MRSLGRFQTGYLRGMPEHCRLIEGAWPAAPDQDAEQPLEAVVNEAMADRLGIRVGERYELRSGKPTDFDVLQIPVRISGIWAPEDPEETYWFLAASVYDELLLLSEETYRQRVILLDEPFALYYVAWYQVYDGRGVTAEDVPGLLGRIRTVQARLRGLMPGIGFPTSPEWALTRHGKAVSMQSNILLAYGLPVIGFVLFFTGFIASMAVGRRQNEVALLLSRGTTMPQVVALHLIQALILALVGLGAGLPLAQLLARLIGNTRSFLAFTGRDPLIAPLTPRSLRVGVGVALLATFAYLLPALRSAGLTIVLYWQRVSRMIGRPWWQRAFLDLILLAAGAYGYYVLTRGQGLEFLIGGQGDPFQQPLVLITPALFLFVCMLLFLRLVPLLLSGLAWVSSQLPGTVGLLALRHLARTARAYSGVLLLLGLSISLSLYTASMAWTLDKNLIDRAYYRVGADLSLQERGWTTGASTADPSDSSLPTAGASAEEDAPINYAALPIEDALQIGAVRGACRVYEFAVTAGTSGSRERGTLVGVDRLHFPQASYFRADFAPYSLGEMMNALARAPAGLLADRAFLREQGLAVGDSLALRLADEQRTPVAFEIVGALDLFPTLYPQDFPAFVGNGDYILEQVGQPLPGKLWLAAEPTTDPEAIRLALEEIGFRLSAVQDARTLMAKEQGQLLRVGLFGFLSVGFIAVSLLAVLSLTIYAFVSFRQRFIQFGILQAIGLTRRQLEAIFVLEQGFIAGLGALAGTVIGLYGSHVFLPFFQVSYAESYPLPPLLVEIAWQDTWKIYLFLGGALLVLAAGVFGLLRRLRAFEAVKLGTQLTG